MEDFKKPGTNEENIDDSIENINTPLEVGEIKEFQANLDEIDKLEPEEKVKFMDKLKTGLKKVGSVSLMIGGAVIAVTAISFLVESTPVVTEAMAKVAEYDSKYMFTQGHRNISPAEVAGVENTAKFLLSVPAIIGSLLAAGAGYRGIKEK